MRARIISSKLKKLYLSGHRRTEPRSRLATVDNGLLYCGPVIEVMWLLPTASSVVVPTSMPEECTKVKLTRPLSKRHYVYFVTSKAYYNNEPLYSGVAKLFVRIPLTSRVIWPTKKKSGFLFLALNEQSIVAYHQL